jgi:hypothetical protein
MLPSIHLKRGLMKNSVNAMNQEEAACTHVQEKVPSISWAKFKKVYHCSTNTRPYEGRILRQAPSIFLQQNFTVYLQNDTTVTKNNPNQISIN